MYYNNDDDDDDDDSKLIRGNDYTWASICL